MAKRLALLALLAAPSLGAAQITVNESNDQDQIINIQECLGTTVSDNLSFQWTFPAFTQAGTYTIEASDQPNCTAPSSSQAVKIVPLGSVAASSNTGAFPTTAGGNVVAVSTLLPQLGIPANCISSTQNFSICVTLNTAATGTQVTTLVTLDLANPPTPTVTGVSPSDSSLTATWTRGSSTADAGTAGATDSFKITAVNTADRTDVHITDFISPGSVTNGRIGGLKNGVTYDVTVQAFSPGRNPSGVSNALQGTPVPVNDFWRIYRSDGGREGGGCAAGAAGMIALLAVPLALRAWRRRA